MPYPTATIYVPWDALTDTSGVIDPARLPANVALTDADETFDEDVIIGGNLDVATLDVNGDIVCGEDIGAVGSIAAGSTLSAGTTVSAPSGFYEHGRGVALGAWQDVAFSAGNFTSSAGTWTVAGGNVAVNRYTLIGQTLIWAVQINAATLTGAGTYLLIEFPVSVAQVFNSACAIATDGVPVIVPALILGVSGKLGIRQASGASWANGANNYVSFTATAELS